MSQAPRPAVQGACPPRRIRPAGGRAGGPRAARASQARARAHTRTRARTHALATRARLRSARCARGGPRSGVWKQLSPGQALARHWSNTGQTLVKHWSGTGQALVRHWSNTGQTLVKHTTRPSANQWSNTIWPLVQHDLTSGQNGDHGSNGRWSNQRLTDGQTRPRVPQAVRPDDATIDRAYRRLYGPPESRMLYPDGALN